MTDEGTLEHRGHRVWWGRAGAPGRAAPLLTVHGGPSLCHDYLEPLADLGSDRPVIFYDQYGCGRSDRAADPEEYDVDLLVDEVATVHETLAPDGVHLLAHSYGGPLALEYLLRRRPAGVLSLTLSNSFPSARALDAGWDRRLGELAPGRAEVLRSGPSGDEQAYDEALGEFVARFVLPGAPPEPLARSQQGFGGEAYSRLHGPSWFQPQGQWSTWDPTPELATIKVPTLVIGGTRDQCPPAAAEQLAAGIPGAELVVLDAAHLPFFEVPEEYLELVRGFLARAEAEAGPGSAAAPR